MAGQKVTGTNSNHIRAGVDGNRAAISAGPLPPAIEFAGYENAVPGAGDRILTMAEKEGDHRRSCEAKDGARAHVCHLFGQFLGFVLIGGTVAGGVWLVFIGKENWGVGVAGGGLFTAIVAYLKAYSPNQST